MDGGAMTDMKLIASVDLSRLASLLEAEGSHPALVKIVRRAAATGSIRDDLIDAGASLKLIDRFTHGDSGPVAAGDRTDTVTIVGALFDRAIILYARATTSKGDRTRLLAEPTDPVDRALHDEVLKLRNEVVAHFGRGGFLDDGPLYKEAVVLHVFDSGGAQKDLVNVYIHRKANRAAFATRFADLIERRLALVVERYGALSLSVRDQLMAAVQDDPGLLPRFAAHQFDPGPFFETPGLAQAYRDGVERMAVVDTTDAAKVPRA